MANKKYRRLNFEVEEEEQLIDLVRKHPCLYNKKEKDYMNSQYKARIYQEIGQKLNKSG